jgi:hypothetical protein
VIDIAYNVLDKGITEKVSRFLVKAKQLYYTHMEQLFLSDLGHLQWMFYHIPCYIIKYKE